VLIERERVERRLRILHLEDSECDAELVSEFLRSDGIDAEITHTNEKARYLSALEQSGYDVILCDHNIPGYDGLSALRHARERQSGVPVIVVSGSIGEEEAVRCLEAGAADYLLKDRLQRLSSAVRRVVDHAETERRQARTESARRELEVRFARFAEQSEDVFWFFGHDPIRVMYVSPAVEKIWGYPVDAHCGDPRLWMRPIHPDDQTRVHRQYAAFISGESSEFWEEFRLLRPDGTLRHIAFRVTLSRDDDGHTVGASGIARDVTERKELEDQFRQAQKMEAIGRLAGGIAHDFNNLLTAIIGYSELVLERVQNDPEISADIQEVKTAGERASRLTSQLLAFSRKQAVVPRVLDLNQIVSDVEKMLKRVIGEDVGLDLTPAPQLGRVKVDRGQVEQVLLNLAVNARDAMPRGGALHIGTANVVLDDTFARHHAGAVPGRYVSLTVRDTGVGMNPEVAARVFEPFFTTKPVGKGTGLGLSTVYGIVKQNNGYVTVDSEPGVGTTFTIYWPEVDEPAEVSPAEGSPLRTVDGIETVLLVDDEPGVRELVRKLLERHGYRVLAATDGADALAIEKQHDGPIDLLLTDVVMPALNGPDLAQRLVRRRPAMPVLYMSGFAHQAMMGVGTISGHTDFLQKPFSSDTLALKVRECLDRQAAAVRHGESVRK